MATPVTLWPHPAGAAEGKGGGSGVTTLHNQPGLFCTHALMNYKSDATYQGTYSDAAGGGYTGALIVELQPGAGRRVSQNPDGTLDPNCTAGTAGYKYPITGMVRSPNGAVSCTYTDPRSRYWRVGMVATADLYGSCSVNGHTWPTHERHTMQSIGIGGPPPPVAHNYGMFVARDIGQRPPGAPPPPIVLPVPTTTTTTTAPAQAPAAQEAPPPPPPQEAAGPSGPAPGAQEPLRGGGLAQAQQPPAQQAQSQFAQQVQAQQQTQVQAQPAMMLEHQRQLQVEKATIQRRGGRKEPGLLASARRPAPAPVAVAATGWAAALGMFGLGLCHRRSLERRLVRRLEPARASARPHRRGQQRWR